MAAGAAEAELEAARAGAADGDMRHAYAVYGDEAVDAGMIAENRLDAAQVAAAFLADIAGEHDVGAGFDAAFFQHFDDRQQHGQAAGVIADAGRVISAVAESHGGVDFERKHGVEMGRYEQYGAVAGAAADADGVAFGVDAGVG